MAPSKPSRACDRWQQVKKVVDSIEEALEPCKRLTIYILGVVVGILTQVLATIS